MKASANSFWVINVTNTNVTLSDLNITIEARHTLNLLDAHYPYTLEQLQKSEKSGSLYIKRNKILKRICAPEIKKEIIICDIGSIIPNREKSMYSIKEQNYEELNAYNIMSDEKFAADNADLAELDQTVIPNRT
jgi:hypothetical protein